LNPRDSFEKLVAGVLPKVLRKHSLLIKRYSAFVVTDFSEVMEILVDFDCCEIWNLSEINCSISDVLDFESFRAVISYTL
jgi:hypothetical protein